MRGTRSAERSESDITSCRRIRADPCRRSAPVPPVYPRPLRPRGAGRAGSVEWDRLAASQRSSRIGRPRPTARLRRRTHEYVHGLARDAQARYSSNSMGSEPFGRFRRPRVRNVLGWGRLSGSCAVNLFQDRRGGRTALSATTMPSRIQMTRSATRMWLGRSVTRPTVVLPRSPLR